MNHPGRRATLLHLSDRARRDDAIRGGDWSHKWCAGKTFVLSKPPNLRIRPISKTTEPQNSANKQNHLTFTRAKGQTLSSSGVASASLASASNLPSRIRAEGQTFAVKMGPAAVAELYSPPRVTAALPRPGCGQQLPRSRLVAGSTFDLYADAAGVAWDFTRPGDRKLALDRLRAEEPYLVVGSPPCTMFSRLNVNLNSTKISKETWEKRLREATVLLTFAATVYALQVSAGRHFLHEHPAGATSWAHPTIAKLRARGGGGAVASHPCAFGLETSTGGRGRAPVLYPHLTQPTNNHM